MKISEVKIGYTFNHPRHGQGMIVARTKRTLTAQFKGAKCKVTYRSEDEWFNTFDF